MTFILSQQVIRCAVNCTHYRMLKIVPFYKRKLNTYIFVIFLLICSELIEQEIVGSLSSVVVLLTEISCW